MQTASLDILEKTQLPPNQARAILRVMELEITAHQETLATKSDLRDAVQSTKDELRAAVQATRDDLQAAVQATRDDLQTAVQAIRNDLKDAVHGLELKIENVRAEIKGSEGKTARWVLTCTMGQAAMIAGAVYFALTHFRG